MNADADRDRPFRMLRGRARGGGLNRETTAKRATGRRKDQVEAVALGLDLGATMPPRDLAHEPPIDLEQVGGSPVALGLRELRIAAEVGEQEAPCQVRRGGPWSERIGEGDSKVAGAGVALTGLLGEGL